jgi:hypothetical protein
MKYAFSTFLPCFYVFCKVMGGHTFLFTSRIMLILTFCVTCNGSAKTRKLFMQSVGGHEVVLHDATFEVTLTGVQAKLVKTNPFVYSHEHKVDNIFLFVKIMQNFF